LTRSLLAVVIAGLASLAPVSVGGGWSPTWAFASAQVPTRNYLELEWQVGQTRSGAPLVWGYVHNIYGEPIGNVRLAVEETDAAGRGVGRTVVDVYGIVPPKGTAYFEARVPKAESKYRIVVLRYDLVIHPGSGP
jgi:hypothetical protein